MKSEINQDATVHQLSFIKNVVRWMNEAFFSYEFPFLSYSTHMKVHIFFFRNYYLYPFLNAIKGFEFSFFIVHTHYLHN